jgi:hypothetical protein
MTSGCYASLWSAGSVPAGFETTRAENGRCPPISGTFDNEASEPPGATHAPNRKLPRHFAAFFTGVENAAEIERVVMRSSATELDIDFVDPARTTHVVLHESTDFTCDGIGYVFEHSANVRAREGGSILFAMGTNGCLVERTLARDLVLFFAVLPVIESVSADWNLFCARDAGARP